MTKVVDKKVTLQLVGLDGNAMSLMAAFQRQARKEKWTPEEIKLVLDECMKGDYNMLLCTLMDHCTDPSEDVESTCPVKKEGLRQLVSQFTDDQIGLEVADVWLTHDETHIIVVSQGGCDIEDDGNPFAEELMELLDVKGYGKWDTVAVWRYGCHLIKYGHRDQDNPQGRSYKDKEATTPQ